MGRLYVSEAGKYEIMSFRLTIIFVQPFQSTLSHRLFPPQWKNNHLHEGKRVRMPADMAGLSADSNQLLMDYALIQLIFLQIKPDLD